MSPYRTAAFFIFSIALVGSQAGESGVGARQPVAQKQAAPTDLYGDPLPADAVARLGTTRLSGAHGDCLAFSPDGKTLALGDGLGAIRLFDPGDGKELRRLSGHRARVFSIAFSPDGKALASVSEDGSLRLWDSTAGKELRQSALGIDQFHRYWGCRPLMFSADGKVLSLFVFSDGGRDSRFWEVATAKPMPAPAAPVAGAWVEALSPDGRTVVAEAEGKRLVWDRASGAVRGRLEVSARCDPVSVSPDGRIVALVPKASPAIRKVSPGIQLWDVASGKELARCEGHKMFVSALAFSPDGKFLASGGGDEKVRFWECATGKELWHYQGRGGGRPGIRALAFSPDARTLAAIGWDDRVRLLNAVDGKELGPDRPHPGGVISLDFTPDGKKVVTGGYDLSLRVWETATGKQAMCLREPAFWNYDPNEGFTPPPGQISSVVCSPDGKWVAVGERAGLSLWDIVSDAQPRQLDTAMAHCLAFSPDGKMLASCNRWVHLWDVHAGKKLRQLQGLDDSGAYALSFSPDGRLLATGGLDQLIRLWDVGTGKQVGKLNGGTLLRALSFSPDGRSLVSSGDDFTVRVWEIATRQERTRIARRQVLAHQRIPFSADGRYLALTFAGTTHFHSALTGEDVHQYKLSEGTGLARALSPDGRTIALLGSETLIMDARRVLPPTSGAAAALAPKDLEELWSRLAAPDTAQAAQALERLSDHPEQAVRFLGGALSPARPPARTIGDMIRDLDDKNFTVREKATDELAKLGRDAETLLRQALQKPASEEVRRRLERLLLRLDDHVPPAETLRVVRAIEVLERIGNRGAHDLLRALAQGSPEARQTLEARSSLERLAKRAKAP
jgi:WD40 repeat protein